MALVRSGKCGTAAAAKGAPRLPRSRTMRLQQAGQKVAKALAPQRLAGYDARYPCFVISLTQLAKLDRLRPHEELLQVGPSPSPGPSPTPSPTYIPTPTLALTSTPTPTTTQP